MSRPADVDLVSNTDVVPKKPSGLKLAPTTVVKSDSGGKFRNKQNSIL